MQTPINLMLTWIAVFDMLTMISYVPFAVHFYIEYPSHSLSPGKNSLAWMRFLQFQVNLSATTHTISIWLGVSLAIFRYNHIQSPESGNLAHMRRIIRSRIVIFGIIAGSILLLIPNYMSIEVIEYSYLNNTIYIIRDLKLGTSNVKPVVFLNLTLYSVVAKFIPCLLMLIYGALLLRTLDMQVRIKRRNLSRMGVVLNRPLHTSRTTVMLLIVMVLFLLTELPQAILLLISLIRKGFFDTVYIPLGDAMDILALVNNSINFVLYCSMNREFRRTLIDLMCKFDLNRNQPRKLSNGTELITEAINKCSDIARERNTNNITDITTDDMGTGLYTAVTDSNGDPQEAKNMILVKHYSDVSYGSDNVRYAVNDSSAMERLSAETTSGIDNISGDISDETELALFSSGAQSCSV
ncbi:hypothetical protein FSP39_000349 [Pinctada imbricata]|uniref:G-protein coupled receptors family 1 profile domain-containing protein n=1 Tax=Pinctada imbricata TaxID=66713 RepID=A0AA88YF93_PINIB|nr:hypothetical protein FSP39_000349 [Pinctada imbricata]